jgi:hypothetical protein
MLGGVGINPDSAIPGELFVGIERAKVQRKIPDGGNNCWASNLHSLTRVQELRLADPPPAPSSREFRHKRPQCRPRWGSFFACGITTARASSGSMRVIRRDGRP